MKVSKIKLRIPFPVFGITPHTFILPFEAPDLVVSLCGFGALLRRASGFRVALGLWVLGLGLWVWSLGFWAFGVKVLGLEFGV